MLTPLDSSDEGNYIIVNEHKVLFGMVGFFSATHRLPLTGALCIYELIYSREPFLARDLLQHDSFRASRVPVCGDRACGPGPVRHI